MSTFHLFKFRALCKVIKFRFKKSKFIFFSKIGWYGSISYCPTIKVNLDVNISSKGKLELGKNVMLGVSPSPYLKTEIYIETRTKNAFLTIGDNVCINNNAVIIVDKSSITIGDNTLIGPNFMCVDSDFHSINPKERLTPNYKFKSVSIGKNVFIGANVTILKGSVIGDNSVIGAGCVISGIVDSNTIVSLNNKQNLIFRDISDISKNI